MVHRLHPGRVGRWILAVLGLLIVVLALCEALGWRFLRDPITQRLSDAMRREVNCGPTFRLHLLGSLRLHCSELRLGSPQGAPFLLDDNNQPRPFARAADLHLAVPWSTLFALRRGDMQALAITSLQVQQLEANLARDKPGHANWQFGNPDQPKKDKDEDTAFVLPRFGELWVREGRVRVEDAVAAVSVDGTLATREGNTTTGAGLEAQAQGRWRNQPMRAQLQAGGVLPLVAGASAPPVPVTLKLQAGDTRIELDGRVADLLQMHALDARFAVDSSSLGTVGEPFGLTLPATGPFQMQGRIAKQDMKWHADVQSFRVGSSRLRGAFDFDAGVKPPRLAGTLAGERLALADLAPAVGAEGQAPAPTARAQRTRVLPQREFDLPKLGAMQADVKLDLAQATLGTSALEDFKPLQGRVLLKDSALTVQDLLARTAGGELRGSLGLDARPAQPLWQAQLRWSGVQLERFVKPRNPAAARPGDAPAPGYVSGVLSGQAQLRGAGRSTAAMLGSLDGAVDLWIRNGALSHLVIEALGLDLAQALGVVVKGDRRLPLNCAVVRMQAKDGLVQPQVAVFDTADTTFVASGQVSLAQERMSLVITPRPKDFSPLTLRSPVTIDGTFAQPDWHLDKTRIGLKLGAAAALAALNPLAAILPLMDPGEKDQGGCQRALQQFGR